MKKIILFAFLGLAFISQAQLINFVQTPTVSSFMGGGQSTGKFSQNKNQLIDLGDMMNNGSRIFKFKSNGDTIWTRIFPQLVLNDFDELSDGTFMGFMSTPDSLVIHKLNTSGNSSWRKKLLLPAGGAWANVAVQSNGLQTAYIMGSSYWTSGGHMLVGNLDSSGQSLFTTHIDMSSWFGTNLQFVTPQFIRKTSTGNYRIMGITYTTTGVPTYLFFIEVSSSGVLNWVKTYQTGVGNSNPSFTATSFELTANNEMLVGGYKYPSTGTAFMRLDASGNILWGKNINDGVSKTQLIELSGGNLALHMQNSNQVPDAATKNMLSVLTSNGTLQLTRSFGVTGGGTMNYIYSVGQDASGKIMAVSSNGQSSSNPAFYVYNMDALGNATGCFDVINTLPITSWAPSTTTQTLSANSLAPPTLLNIANKATQYIECVKSNRNILTNGAVTNPLCHGLLGAVNINPSNGNSPYAYGWSNGTNSQNLLNVPGGIYTIRISDVTGCVGLDTFNVVEPTLLATTYTVSHVTCFGTHNGSINVTVSGGTPGYTYQWTTQATTQNLSNLSGGFYQLTVTDANNCTKILAVSVNEPQQLIAGIISSQNVTCHGDCNGALTGIASGGTQPYSYLWNNSGTSTTTAITGLCPGNYLFSVTDSKNCNTFSNAVITEPSALSISTSTLGALCGVSTGQAAAVVVGGVSPYTYHWSNSTTNDTVFNLSAGTYSVGVLDADNCPISSNVTVGLVTPTPQLCMVTVDSLSTHNILLWDKTGLTHIAYFNIFREDITNSYTLIAAVNYDSLSEYHDYDTLMADPNITTKRYKISAVDSCGNESAKSNFHNTLFMQHNNGTFTWNTYTIQNSANPVTSYLLMRDDFANGNWQQIGTTAGTQNVLNDPNYSAFQNTANWQVVTAWAISCSPTLRQSNGTLSAIVKSKSNITNNRMVGIKNNSTNTFAVYPNPATDILSIELDKMGVNTKIEIVNMLGEIVKQINVNEYQSKINVSDLANGMYNLKIISSEKQVYVKRVLIQR